MESISRLLILNESIRKHWRALKTKKETKKRIKNPGKFWFQVVITKSKNIDWESDFHSKLESCGKPRYNTTSVVESQGF